MGSVAKVQILLLNNDSRVGSIEKVVILMQAKESHLAVSHKF